MRLSHLLRTSAPDGAARAVLAALVAKSALLAGAAVAAAAGWLPPRALAVILAALAMTVAATAVLHVHAGRAAERRKRRLASGISHEVRTPLAQIRMLAETLLLGRERSAEERIRWVEVIRRETVHLGDLLENWILFTQLDGPGVYFPRRPADLTRIVKEAAASREALAAARGMEIVTRTPPSTPVEVDAHAIRQVLVNLLDNAVKHGAPEQTVTVALEVRDGRAEVSVTDAGPGVPEAERARIWEPFVRLREDETAGGSGLGLAVVRRVVDAHGGDAWVEDAPGGGARFRLRLAVPRASAPATEPDGVAIGR